MLVKQRLRLNAVVLVAAVLGILVVLALTTYRVDRAIDVSKIADGIITATFERVTLRTDFLRTGSERSREQVLAKQKYIGELLKAASENFTDPEDKTIITELVKAHESTGKIFRTIMENRGKRGPNARPDALSQEIEDRLLSQLNMRIYETVLLGGKLQDSGNAAVNSAFRLGGGGILFVLLLVSTAALINVRTLGRSITDRVRGLRDGAAVIGGGNLDYRIDIKGDDEFAELSGSFNEMTLNLRGSYNDLEKEIKMRRQAEESLNRLNVELAQQVEEQTAEVKRANESLEKRIIERTAELQAANETLRASRVAALNLMEDALAARSAVLNLMEDADAARQKSEQLNAELLDEVTERKRIENMLSLRLRLMELTTTHSLEGLLQATLDEVCEITGSPIGFYHFVEADQKTLSLQAWSSRTLREFCTAKGSGAHYDINDAGVWVDCVHQRRPVIHNDYYSLPHRKGLPVGHAQVTRELVVPILRGDRIVAILGVGNKLTDYTEKDVELVSYLADIGWELTERKRIEENVLRLNKDIAARNVELEAANNEMEAFIYSVSHDLRAPIRAISGFSSMLLSGTADRLAQKEQDYLVRISAGAEKMSLLIDGLLNLSRITRQETKKAEIDLSQIAAKLAAEIRQDNPGRNVELIVQEGLMIHADPQLIEIALMNLLGNAWKFTSKTDEARVEFGASEKDGRTIYFVRDNGVGFDNKFAGKMFWPFHRLHSGADFEGTGIGLAIVERIIRRHGGQIWAEGAEGQGATIYFTLE